MEITYDEEADDNILTFITCEISANVRISMTAKKKSPEPQVRGGYHPTLPKAARWKTAGAYR